MMKVKVFTFFMLLSVMALLFSCGKNGKDGGGGKNPAVTVKTEHLEDNSSFVTANGNRCTITAEATIDYPVAMAGGGAVDSLQRLFARYVLESGDSLSLKEAMRQVVANSMHQYDFVAEPVPDDEKMEVEESDALTVTKYATNTRVTPVYIGNGVVTFERVDVVTKNDKVASETHRYYSFDMESMSYIDVNRLFRDDAIADVCQLLRQQLLAQNNVTGNEQLNDLGYFNVENITVSRNFYFDDKGVTWSFLPNELAVEAVGEPKITIPYGDLKPSLCENSILERF